MIIICKKKYNGVNNNINNNDFNLIKVRKIKDENTEVFNIKDNLLESLILALKQGMFPFKNMLQLVLASPILFDKISLKEILLQKIKFIKFISEKIKNFIEGHVSILFIILNNRTFLSFLKNLNFLK